MYPCLLRYEDLLVKLNDDCNETQKLYKELLVKFGESDGTDSEELFGYFKNFAIKFQEVLVKLEAPKKPKAESVWPFIFPPLCHMLILDAVSRKEGSRKAGKE